MCNNDLRTENNIENNTPMKNTLSLTSALRRRLATMAALILAGLTTATAQVTVGGSVYGGGALANVTGNTQVDILDGTVENDVYGGGLGDAGTAANVGSTQVNIGASDASSNNNVWIKGNVFGANNVNGTPTGTVNVDIYSIKAVASPAYSLAGVYGGGNLANYIPTNESNVATVVVHNCFNQIAAVYGGGNAAAVPATSVTIWGGTLGDVFAGGNGSSTPAHVGYKTKVDAPTVSDNYGTGNTYVDIKGGTIANVYGGSNSKGMIRGTINVNVNKEGSCEMHLGSVYGGGNLAASQAGTVNIGCTGTSASEGVADVYGGANQANVTGDINLTITGGNVNRVFGGNNNSGTINGDINVNVNWTDPSPCSYNYLGSVFGGGNLAAYSGAPTVTLTNGTVSHSVYGGGNEAGVAGSLVNINGGQVIEGVYGGCNTSGTVSGDIAVNIHGGTLGTSLAPLTSGIFGGGYGVATATTGNVTVTIGDEAGTYQPVIFGDIYGGSALGNVNDNASDVTTVNFLNGTLTGNLFGGGLGDGSHAAKVNGQVIVNISNTTQSESNCHINLSAASIYGGNNTNGSPQDDVTVHVYKTGHTTTNEASYTTNIGSGEPTYAIDQVFGGGKQADYLPENGNANSTKKTTVYIHDCFNTVRRVFSGGDAAAATGVATIIDGGRFDYVFGGGNGEVTAANIGNGGTDLKVHGGTINMLFGGSNTSGVITGPMRVDIDNTSPCAQDQDIIDFYCGNNLADLNSGVTANVRCGTRFRNFYGGCNQADLTGDITLNIFGGTFEKLFGGSNQADIKGNITVNVFSGDIEEVFGGNNNSGYIFGDNLNEGNITVNIDIDNNICPSEKRLNFVYGGGNLAEYKPDVATGLTTTATAGATNYAFANDATFNLNANRVSPVVNVISGTVETAVFGGGKGSATEDKATIKSNTKVDVGAPRRQQPQPDGAGFYSGVTAITPTADGLHVSIGTNGGTNFINGDIFGGGNAAKVDGNTNVIIRGHSKVFGNVYGGGNEATVSGDTKVIVNDKTYQTN